MIKGNMITFKRFLNGAAFTAAIAVFSSCQEMLPTTPKAGKRVDAVDSDFYYTGKGYIFESNPVISTGNPALTYPEMGNYVSAKHVTDNPYLETLCQFESAINATTSQNCFRVMGDVSDTSPLQAKNGGWGYSVGSDEFYQVNTFYHVNKIIKRFYASLGKAISAVHNNGETHTPPATKYDMYNTLSFWLTETLTDPNDSSNILGVESATLNVYSKCYTDPFNAYFSPAENKICLGWNEDYSFLLAAQDPSVIYHEMGHVLVKAMMNQRNVSANFPNIHATPFQSELGQLFYDEGKSINEGIADWFSYYMTGRKHFGEWALGRFHNSSRAMTENDDLHKGRVSTAPGERLSYPNFVYYNPNKPEKNYEDVHYAGQVVSHYLVALTEELKACSSASTDEAKHEAAGDMVLMLINETLAELGDMTGKGSDVFDEFRNGGDPDLGAFFVNLNNQESYLWAHQVNPINFRKFFQAFAKNIKHKISDTGKLCPLFDQDQSEYLLDEYGLLLFNDYGDSRTGVKHTDMVTYVKKEATTTETYYQSVYGLCSWFNSFLPVDQFCPQSSPTGVNEFNRRNTVLVTKDLVDLPDGLENVSPVYISDSYSEIKSLLGQLTFEGKNVLTSEGLADVKYNHNNLQIGPGEIVGIALNLYNSSNSTIGGVQVLANDWDHMKLYDQSKTYVNRVENSNAGLDTANWSPCQFDGWPNSDENGAVDADPANPQEGDCGYPSLDNFAIDTSSPSTPKYYPDSPQPACVVQYSAENETQWVSQDFFRKTGLDLGEHECLNDPSMSGERFNPNECLVRFLPGADHAIYGKIDAQKSWTQTLSDSTTSEGITMQQNNLLLMEVNKNLAPGTVFNCRLRVRFTNCSDCYENPDTGEEFTDYDMTGPEPFKLINFKFTIGQ